MSYTKSIAIRAIALFLLLPQFPKAQPDDHDFQKSKNAAIAELKKFPKPDTARVNALINVFTTATFFKERQEVSSYRTEALLISKRLNYPRGLVVCYLSMGNYYKSALDYPKAFIYYDSALAIINQTGGKELLEQKAIAYERKGMMYHSQENYYPALDCYFESLKTLTDKTRERESRLFTFITDAYVGLKNLDKAIEFSQKNLALIQSDSNVMRHSSPILAFINICLEKNDLHTAETYLDKLSPYMPDPKEIQVNFGYYLKKGHIHYLRQRYENAYAYYQMADKYAIAGGHKVSRGTTLRFLSRTALKLGNSVAAKNYALQNLELAEEMNAKQGKIEALTNLSDYYSELGNKSKAFELMSQVMQLKDSLISETNTKQINILGAIYESDKQQKEIAQLQNEKVKQTADVKQKSLLNKVFIATSIVLLIFSYIGYKNFRNLKKIADQRQEIQQQKIIELEKDKQLLAIDAMLKGQEEERSRIAKDLHDGLGGFLSGTKMSFMNVKEKLVLSPENAELFNKSLGMLDNTINDLRKVARNLMPEALVKFGLQEALRDFCDAIQSSSGVKVVYQQFGETRILDKTAEVFIYRIIQELVNNSIKHAEAKRIIVQFTMSHDRTGITVEDDGKGFDKNNMDNNKGSGMANIAYRVQYFNGTMDIVTSPGNGTSISIELMT